MLYYTDINAPRVLIWSLLFTIVLPAFLGAFLLIILLFKGQEYFQTEFVSQFPWGLFTILCVLIGIIITALAWKESANNNRLWKTFFSLPAFEELKALGFELDRYGLHGFWQEVPVSIYYEKETLGDFAKITAHADVSLEVEELKALGAKFGKEWFFLVNEYEHFLDPPFKNTDWEAALTRATDMGKNQSFKIADIHPWMT